MRDDLRHPPYLRALLQALDENVPGRSLHCGHWGNPLEIADPAKLELTAFIQAQARLNKIMTDMASVRDGQTVLDIGCGLGGTLKSIDQTNQDMELIGVDADSGLIGRCAKLTANRSNRFHWIEADACALPFTNGRVDRILCIESMFHFSSRRSFFREAARLLRPGGVMVISDILIGPMAEQSYSADPDIEQILRAAFGEWPDVLGEDTDLPALAEEAGLSCAASLDATANILPNLHFAATTQAGSKTETKDVLADAADLLSRLYEQGLCRYVYMRFDKTDDVF